jgi:hypothetical protein
MFTYHTSTPTTMSNQEMAYDDGKREATPTIPVVVHDDEEYNIVPASTTMMATETNRQNPDGWIPVATTNVQSRFNDGVHIGSNEYMANRLMESPSVADDSMSETTDLEDNDEVAPETTTMGNTLIGKRESEEVHRFKFVVLLILLVSAAVVATCVNIYVKKKEQSQFDEKFRLDASKILDTVRNSIDRTFIPMDSLAVDLVSFARATNSTWPCVTLPNFALRMSKALRQTDAMVIQFLPIVKPSQRKKWEHYVSQNYFWLNETMAIQDTWDGYYGPIGYDWKEKNIIWGDNGDVEANVRLVSPSTGVILSLNFKLTYCLLAFLIEHIVVSWLRGGKRSQYRQR